MLTTENKNRASQILKDKWVALSIKEKTKIFKNKEDLNLYQYLIFNFSKDKFEVKHITTIRTDTDNGDYLEIASLSELNSEEDVINQFYEIESNWNKALLGKAQDILHLFIIQRFSFHFLENEEILKIIKETQMFKFIDYYKLSDELSKIADASYPRHFLQRRIVELGKTARKLLVKSRKDLDELMFDIQTSSLLAQMNRKTFVLSKKGLWGSGLDIEGTVQFDYVMNYFKEFVNSLNYHNYIFIDQNVIDLFNKDIKTGKIVDVPKSYEKINKAVPAFINIVSLQNYIRREY